MPLVEDISNIQSLLNTPQKIAIVHHYNADADALGSSLALKHYLEAKKHQVLVISPNAMPEYLCWMPGAKEVLVFENQEILVKDELASCTLLFCLDFNQFSRTKSLEAELASFKGIKILIDHHLFPDTNAFDYGISLPTKSSTCEMVYDFIVGFGDKALLTKDIASCLYAGAMTDTGSFKFDSTTPSVHLMVAHLMQTGINISVIHQNIFDNFNENRLRFLGYVLSEKMILIPECHSAIMAITREEIQRFAIQSGETEGIVNYPLSLKHIVFSTFITERELENRMSFRSKGTFDVNEFARKYFEGGGHLNAAGGKTSISLSQTVELLKNYTLENKQNLIQCYHQLVS